MANLNAYADIGSSNGFPFSNNKVDDFIFYTDSSNQSILFGTAQSNNSAMAISFSNSSNIVTINGNTFARSCTFSNGISILSSNLMGATAPLYIASLTNPEPSANGIFIYNSNNSNAASNHSIVCLRTAGVSSGNPLISFDVLGANGWCMGIDNSDSQKFKIARNYSTLSNSTTVITIDSNALNSGLVVAAGYPSGNHLSSLIHPDSRTCIGWNLGAGDASAYFVNSFNSSTYARGFAFSEAYRNSNNISITARISQTGVYSALSDYRLKENKILIENAVETLSKITPMTFDKYNQIQRDSNCHFAKESGLIAQDVYFNAPELRHLVTLDSNLSFDSNATFSLSNTPDTSAWGSNTWFLSYTQFIPYLIKAIQEQQSEIDELKKKLN